MKSWISSLLLAWCVSTGVSAAEESRALANKFVSALRYDEQFEKFKEQCITTYRAITPDALVKQNPDYFGGLRPGHVKWRRVVSAYEVYFQEACSRPSKDEFLAALSASYAKSLSVSQLKSGLQFYSTATGRALISAHSQATTAVYEEWTRSNQEHLVQVSAKFQAEISKIAGEK